jgi:geranylgeranyl pyrophosphate synthase
MRWYDPILEPVAKPVAAARTRAGLEDVPRSGLFGAWAALIGRAFGTRSLGEPTRLAVMGAEVANARIYLGEPEPGLRKSWLARDFGLLLKIAGYTAKEADPRILLHLLEPCDLGKAPIPEAVISFRATTAAAAIAAQIPFELYHALDRIATGLGLKMEPEVNPAESLRGAGATSIEELLKTPLPDSDATERIYALHPEPSPPGRRFLLWNPQDFLKLEPAVSPVDQRIEAILGDAAPMLAKAACYLRGGKRLRSRLCLAAGGSLMDAAIVEMIHDASLILDDIVDEAELRRGRLALHRATDLPTAIGAALLLLSRSALLAQGLPEQSRSLLLNTVLALASGQTLELQEQPLTRTTWYRVAAQKTASLWACVAAPGGNAAVKAARELGLAFQIIDDLLDCIGDPKVTGKNPGADFYTGKPSFARVLIQEAGRSPRSFEEALADFQALELEPKIRKIAREHLERGLRGEPEWDELARLLVERVQ